MNHSVLHINSYLKDRTFYKGLYDAQICMNTNIRVFCPLPYGNRGKADNVGHYVDAVECYTSLDRFFFFQKQEKAIKKAEEIYNFDNIDIIHAHSMCTNGYIAYKLSMKYGKPYIITVRNGDLNNIYKKMLFLRPTFNKVIKNASKVIFLSEPYRLDVTNNCVPKEMKKDLEKKSVVIPNGIDKYWLNNIDKNEKKMHSPLILAYSGEINRNKNIQTLIRVVEILNRQGKDTYLNIYGEIVDPSLRKLLNNKFVRFNGKLNKEKLLEAYKECDIFIMVSKKEAFGLVYAEALSQGLPIIYTKDQGFDRQFEEGVVGYHVDCNSIEEIINAINNISLKYSLLSNNAKKEVKKFEWMNIAKIYEDLYRKC